MAGTRITNDWVIERFDRIYPAHRIAFARLLIMLRDSFGGDMDAMLVMLTLSLGVDRSGWSEALFTQFDNTTEQVRLTNTMSISMASGIPRETVRRKLDVLQKRGWVTRDEAGNWTPTARAAEDLRAASLETVQYIRAIVAAAYSADGETPSAPPAST